MPAISVAPTPFDPWDMLAHHQRERAPDGAAGATAVFVGTMRDFNEGDPVESMVLEHYPGMTERELERIANEACERWSVHDVLIHHRVGDLHPGDPIVLVAVWSAHRRAALDACAHLIEVLKTRAPFWKKETIAEGERWVHTNTRG